MGRQSKASYNTYLSPVRGCDFDGFTKIDLSRHLLLIHQKNTTDINDLKKFYDRH